MAIWWLTEAIHISATALLPLVLFPLTGALPMEETAGSYGNPLIFLFLGGFVLSLSMQRWGLHRRIALHALRISGEGTAGVIGGMMAITAILSMWVSNTATVVMMLPIAASVVEQMLAGRDESSSGTNVRVALMLGIAYAASIGGIATLIGSPPNLLAASFISETYGREISFVEWMSIGLPVVVIFLPTAWYLLTKKIYPLEVTSTPGLAQHAREELRQLGRMSRGERATMLVFSFAVMLWIFRPLIVAIEVFGGTPFSELSDAGVAMLAALLLFAWPVNMKEHEYVMSWKEMKDLPWGVLILFGGGLALAAAIEGNGLAQYIGSQLSGLTIFPTIAVIGGVVLVIIFLTELTSNTATTAAFLPILAGIAPVLGIESTELLIPAAIAASCAFMMPVATPPNALVFATGAVEMRHMVRAGFWLNVIGVILVTLLAVTVVRWVG
jgi:sodium-dependent dicarboxylate transporter 2/3/5